MLLVVLLLGWSLVPTAADAQTGSSASILIDEVSPSTLKESGKLRISGRMVNVGEAEIIAPAVQLDWSAFPLSGREEIAGVFAGASQREASPVSGTWVSRDEPLSSGEEWRFSLRVPVKSLGLPDGPGVFAAFVVGFDDGQQLSRAGTAIPWFPRGSDYRPSRLALMWPIVQVPSVAANQLVMNPDVVADYEPEGRLSTLVSLMNQYRVAPLVDSSVVELATELSNGYQVVSGQGVEQGDGAADAERFAGEIEQATGTGKSVLPGFAIADADALQRILPSYLVRSATLPTIVMKDQVKTGSAEPVFYSPSGNSDFDTMSELVAAGTRTFIMSDRFFPPVDFLTYTPTGATTLDVGGSEVTVLLTDQQLSRLLRGDLRTTESREAIKQQLLAQTAMITLERPTTPRSVAAAPHLTWNPPTDWVSELAGDLQSAPWVRLIPWQRMASGELVTRSHAPYGAKQQKRELSSDYLRRIKQLNRDVATLNGIVADRAGLTEGFTMALQRASSALWRNRTGQADQLVQRIAEQIAVERAKVRVVSSGQVTLSGDTGSLPLTVANDLEEDVRVGLVLQADNDFRLEYDQPAAFTVPAGQKSGVEIPIRVFGSQPLEIGVLLTDADGKPYERAATLQVQSTASTRVAGIVVGVGALAVLVLALVRFWGRRRDDH